MLGNRTIKCPVCEKGRFINIDRASGKISVKCETCHKFILIDWDRMTAERTEPIKYALEY